MGSPLILERSGIGRKDILNKFNIPVVQELPGVGENYQGARFFPSLLSSGSRIEYSPPIMIIDHPAVFTPYYADPETTTMDAIFRGDADFVAKVIPQYQKDRTGWLATKCVLSLLSLHYILRGTSGVDAICKMRPHPDEVAQLGPEFKKYWDEVLKDYPDKPLFILMATGGYAARIFMFGSCADDLRDSSPGDAPAEPTKKFICHNTFLVRAPPFIINPG